MTTDRCRRSEYRSRLNREDIIINHTLDHARRKPPEILLHGAAGVDWKVGGRRGCLRGTEWSLELTLMIGGLHIAVRGRPALHAPSLQFRTISHGQFSLAISVLETLKNLPTLFLILTLTLNC